MSNYTDVADWSRKVGIPPTHTPAFPLPNDHVLGCELIIEETSELMEALEGGDIAHVAKEMADVLYVVHQMAYRCGIDMDAVFDAVHESNCSKFCDITDVGLHKKYVDTPYITRKVAREDTCVLLRKSDKKVLKGKHYQPPDIEKVLQIND